MRVRVSLGDVTVELALDELGVSLDGRPLSVELLDERRFDVPGALAFAYPRDWHFTGAVGVPTPVDAWWTLSGEGGAIHLRRHAEGAQAIADLYVENLGQMGGSPPAPVTRQFGTRTLEGRAVELTVGGMHGVEAHRWVQEVFAWEQAPGVDWMVSLQRDLGPVGDVLEIQPWIELLPHWDSSGADFEVRVTADVLPTLSLSSELDRILAAFQWDDGR